MPDSNRRPDVHAPGLKGGQVGDHNTQYNTFVLTAGALAVVAAAGAALTFTYQGWETKASSVSSSPGALSARTRPAPAPTPEPTTRTPAATPSTTSPERTDEPATDPPSTPAFDAATLDDEATDRTPVTVAGLLPDSFSDAKGVRYTRNSGGVTTCGNLTTNGAATAALAAAGCVDSEVVTGTYVDADRNVLVAVEVMALADKDTAGTAQNLLKNDNTGGWRYRCPTVGTGADVCRGAGLPRATQYGYTKSNHRYLISAVAVYVDLRQDSSVQSWLTTASYRAVAVAGPDNHPGNR